MTYDTDLLALANTSEPAPGQDLDAELEAELAGFAALRNNHRADPAASPGSNDLEETS
jgi:hypothetical protein